MYRIIGPHHQYTFSRHWVVLLVVLIVWELVWKGIALWKAGRHNQLGWFVVMLIVNTLGILEIVYLLFFQSKDAKS